VQHLKLIVDLQVVAAAVVAVLIVVVVIVVPALALMRVRVLAGVES
jgi:hypothetical protein